MKDKDLKFGIHKAGKFIFYINKVLNDNSFATDALFFEVLVSEVKPLYNSYVDLVQDSRFNLFSGIINYTKSIQSDDVIDYNNYIFRRYQNFNTKKELTVMPLWKLSRSTLIDLINIAAQIKP
jgi:hypothetical protein